MAALNSPRSLPNRIVLIGHPVAHSLSPHFQNAAIRAAGIDATYEAMDVAPRDLASTVALLREAGAAGNVTIPYKVEVHDLCGVRTRRAIRTGAVNAFRIERGVLSGDNTDVGGFERAVHVLLGREPEQERVAVLGAGGAAAAVLAAVEGWPGSTAMLWNRGEERISHIRRRFPEVFCTTGDQRAVLDGATLVVNATSAGLRGGSLPCDPRSIPDNASVLDLVYRVGNTPFVAAALARGLAAADGREMLLEQGALAFVHWFGCEPDRSVMRRALEDAIMGG